MVKRAMRELSAFAVAGVVRTITSLPPSCRPASADYRCFLYFPDF